jgi:hypothetical protein
MYGISGDILVIKKKEKGRQDITVSTPAIRFDGFCMKMIIWSALASIESESAGSETPAG